MLKHGFVLSAVFAGGCVDAKGSFDQFADRVGFTDASTVDRPPGMIYDVTGTFLYAVRGGFEPSNDPSLYIQFVLTSTIAINGDTGMISGSLVPLCTHSSCSTRNMIPPPLLVTDVAVAADGSFTAPFGGTLPGGGNPFSGTAQPLTAVTTSLILSTDVICGTVTGTAAGLDLAGSTFAAIRITDTTPANLPAPVATCPASMPVDAGVDAPIDAL